MMSTQAFLKVLQDHNLDQYYPDFLDKGIRTPYSLAQLTMQDYSQLGVRSIDDKRKFMLLTGAMKSQQQQQQQQEQQQQQRQKEQQQQQRQKKEPPSQSQQVRKQRSPGIPIEPQKKRPVSTLPSPDRKVRRLTLGSPYIQQQRQTSTTTIPRIASGRFDVASNINRRRLSYAPSKQSNVSPIRNNNITQPQKSSPSKGISTATIKPNSSKFTFSDDLFLNEKRKTVLNQRQPDRRLDAYGIPKSSARGRTSTESNNGNNTATTSTVTNSNTTYSGLSLDEYVDTKVALNPTFATGSLSSSSTFALNLSAAPLTKISGMNQPLPSDLQQRIRVCVRKRPLSRKEVANGEIDISELVGAHTIQLNAPKSRVDLTRYTEQHSFTFDEAFDGNSSNVEIYHRTARPLVNYVFSGGKATCFAFGQTGSGKTYTMLDPKHGLYIMAAKDIFEMLEDPSYQHLSASVGFYEIYQGKLYDLLNQRKQLIPRDDGNSNVVIAGLREHRISDLDRLLQIFEYGSRSRTTGKTGANDNSSRSHAVLQVLLKNKKNDDVYGKLSFIDLAGSERGADRGDANTKTRLEGAEINKSLLALKECIRALDKDKKHTPFRGSKLTQVLRDSFVGDSRTCMIATISPNNSNSEHTLNTLRYADRVKELKGESDPRLQVDPPTSDTNTDEDYYGKYSRQNSNSQRDDAHSVATFDEFWDGDAAENLMDEDFPIDAISSNALGTPRSQRVWTGSTPHRKENYMRRLSSPPAELFRHLADDPFSSDQPTISSPSPKSPHTQQQQQRQQQQQLRQRYSPSDHLKMTPPSRVPATGTRHSTTTLGIDLSTALTPNQQDEFFDAQDRLPSLDKENARVSATTSYNSADDTMTSAPVSTTTTTTPIATTTAPTSNDSSRQVSVDHIRDFVRLQRAQIKQLEDLIKEEKRMIHKLTLTVISCHEVGDDDMGLPATSAADEEKMTLQYETHLNHLEDNLDRKLGCVETLKERVKQELGDEELDD